MKRLIEAPRYLFSRAWQYAFGTKASCEMSYWKRCFCREGNTFHNSHYRKLILAVAGEEDEGFLADKVVADFGCGPRGSLSWAENAGRRIGIDVLAERYQKAFPYELAKHGMEYITCSEQEIPLPSKTVDILSTVNALDHVRNLDAMCSEIRRIIKPGGLLIGSFNLNHRPTRAEPQLLTERRLDELLFTGFSIEQRRLSAPGKVKSGENLYAPFYTGNLRNPAEGPAFLWVRARKGIY